MKGISLSQGYVTLVDDEDYEELSRYNWHVLDSHPWIRYAARWVKRTRPRRNVRMHHAVLRVDPLYLQANYLVVDHIDRNGLNNQKTNLRVTTRSINAYNSQRSDEAVGVYWDTIRGQYKAFQLQPKVFIGWFKTFEAAIEARDSFNANN